MKKILFVVLVSIPFWALPCFGSENSEPLTEKQEKACGSILCLSSTSSVPKECDPPLQKYFSIVKGRWSSTVKARKKFLNQCPVDKSEIDMDGLARSRWYDFISADPGFACDAIACLEKPNQTPGRCHTTLRKYFDIRKRHWPQTVETRQRVLNACPSIPASADINELSRAQENDYLNLGGD